MPNAAPKSLTNRRIVVSRAFTQADTNGTRLALEVPAGTFIPARGVHVYVAEAFAGGSPSLDVGDGDNTDGWVDTTEITETTPGMYNGAAEYALTGKLYTAADTIDVVISASLTNGTAYVLAEMWDLQDVDLAAA